MARTMTTAKKQKALKAPSKVGQISPTAPSAMLWPSSLGAWRCLPPANYPLRVQSCCSPLGQTHLRHYHFSARRRRHPHRPRHEPLPRRRKNRPPRRPPRWPPFLPARDRHLRLPRPAVGRECPPRNAAQSWHGSSCGACQRPGCHRPGWGRGKGTSYSAGSAARTAGRAPPRAAPRAGRRQSWSSSRRRAASSTTRSCARASAARRT
mmetsp:Transcript_2901/g.9060  ORF Transcript_2901/g.9060 Transcript_2901/m.9060 type:complete len:208 (+) Transcript_2901:203-826(+)